MRAGIYRGIRNLVIEDVPAPVAGQGDIVLDVAACGICGSDLHSYTEGVWIADGMGMGHEFSGHVSEIGPGVCGLSLGDAITVNPFVPCGACAQCRAGRMNLCADASASGATAFADQIVIHDVDVGRRVFKIPSGVSLEEACLLEPLSVAVRAVELSRAAPGQTVVVLGLGAIGQCAVQVLRARGVTDVIAVDRSRMRLERAAASGASTTIDGSGADLAAALVALTAPTVSPFQEASSVDVVIECAGAAPLLPSVLRATRAGGTVVLVGLFSRAVDIDFNVVVQKELLVHGSFAYTEDDVRQAFGLIASGAVDMASLITQRHPLDDIQGAFQAQLDAENSIKVVVGPGS